MTKIKLDKCPKCSYSGEFSRCDNYTDGSVTFFCGYCKEITTLSFADAVKAITDNPDLGSVCKGDGRFSVFSRHTQSDR